MQNLTVIKNSGQGNQAGVVNNTLKTTSYGEDGNVAAGGHVCDDNSSTANILADASFTGDWQDTLNYNFIIVGIKSSHDSATDGLAIQWSSDGVTVHDDDVFTISANKGKVFTFSPARRYMRIIYTNGSTDTSSFNLQTIFKAMGSKASSHRIQDNIVAEDDAQLVKSVLTGQDEDGTFQNVSTTVDGDLTISDNSSGLSIAEGNVTGKTFIHKFGNAPDFDATDGDVTVWDGADDGTTWENMVYDYSTSADIQYISSTDAGDTQTIEVQGLDSDYNIVTQTKDLTGQTSATLDTPLIRVFRMKNNNSTDLAGHVFCSTSTAGAGGVPTAANVRAIIQPGNNQTLMAVYTIPAGKTGYMRDWYASTSGANKNSNYTVKVFAKPFGGVFQMKHISALNETGTSYIKHDYTEPEVFAEKTDIEIRMNVLAGGTTAAAVSAGFDIVLVDN